MGAAPWRVWQVWGLRGAKAHQICKGHALRSDEWEQVITYGSVIRVMAELAAEALRGSGKVLIADGAQTDSEVGLICARTHLQPGSQTSAASWSSRRSER